MRTFKNIHAPRDLEKHNRDPEWGLEIVILANEEEENTVRNFAGTDFLFPKRIWNRYIEIIDNLTKHLQKKKEKSVRTRLVSWWQKYKTRQSYFCGCIKTTEIEETLELEFDHKYRHEWEYNNENWTRYVHNHLAMLEAIEEEEHSRRDKLLTILDEQTEETVTAYRTRKLAYQKQEERKKRREERENGEELIENIELELWETSN